MASSSGIIGSYAEKTVASRFKCDTFSATDEWYDEFLSRSVIKDTMQIFSRHVMTRRVRKYVFGSALSIQDVDENPRPFKRAKIH